MQNAQDAGAMAVIVYDNEYEPLIVMSKPIGHHDPAIPAVFVAQKTGVVMQKFLTTGTVTVRIIQVRCKPVCTLGQPHRDLRSFCKSWLLSGLFKALKAVLLCRSMKLFGCP